MGGDRVPLRVERFHRVREVFGGRGAELRHRGREVGDVDGSLDGNGDLVAAVSRDELGVGGFGGEVVECGDDTLDSHDDDRGFVYGCGDFG